MPAPREPNRRRRSPVLIEAIVVALVVVALVAMAIWFFFFAGSPIAPYTKGPERPSVRLALPA